MKFDDALDSIKQAYSLNSDYKLAQFLGISRSRLSLYRTTNRKPCESLVLQVENLLNMEPGELLLIVNSQFAETSQGASVYKALLHRLKSHKTAKLIVFSNLSFLAMKLAASTASLQQCILCQIPKVQVHRCRSDRYL